MSIKTFLNLKLGLAAHNPHHSRLLQTLPQITLQARNQPKPLITIMIFFSSKLCRST